MKHKSKSKSLIAPAIVLAIMVAGAGVLVARNPGDSNQSSSANKQQTGSTPPVPSTEKSQAEKYLETYTGDDYDRYFIANMIAHHQGAVDMAKLALTNAKHQELKTMANDIVTAQTSEIDNMLAWQKAWGYPPSSGADMIDHSGMNMADDMDGMTKQLGSLNSDAFDKKFIELMIQHHGSAINMAKPGAQNAKHQEVKDLTNAIITAQSREITQMQQWWRNWGY